jgi:hypothetical protein
MFGQLFSSPIPQKPPLVPITPGQPPANASTVAPIVSDAVFQADAPTPPPLHQCSTKETNAVTHWFLGSLFGQDFYSAVTPATTPEPVAPPPPATIAIFPRSRPIDPIQPMSLSVATSIPAPTIVFPDHFSSSLSSSIPLIPLFQNTYSRPVISKRPLPKPPHPATTGFHPFPTSHFHNLYSYKLFGRVN